MKPTLLLIAPLLTSLAALHAKQTKPNIFLTLADGLGSSDLGCYGANFDETPHLEQLAKQGVRFTDAYAMSVCSPSRAALLLQQLDRRKPDGIVVAEFGFDCQGVHKYDPAHPRVREGYIFIEHQPLQLQ